jgi:hypothetical protein
LSLLPTPFGRLSLLGLVLSRPFLTLIVIAVVWFAWISPLIRQVTDFYWWMRP